MYVLFLFSIGENIPFPGVRLVPDFVTKDQETAIVQAVDSVPWVNSQSGRRKQVFTVYYITTECIEIETVFNDKDNV